MLLFSLVNVNTNIGEKSSCCKNRAQNPPEFSHACAPGPGPPAVPRPESGRTEGQGTLPLDRKAGVHHLCYGTSNSPDTRNGCVPGASILPT